MTIFVDEKTPRPVLAGLARTECGIELDVIQAATDTELLAMIQDWIEDGDECAEPDYSIGTYERLCSGGAS